MEPLNEIDDFLQQLKKKKRKNDFGTKKLANSKETANLETVKEEDVDVFVTQKKNNKLQKLAQLHSKSEELYKSLEDDYEPPMNKSKPKRVFNYTPKHINEPRPKPVVTTEYDIKETKEVRPTAKLAAAENEPQYPDLYYGVSSTLEVLKQNDCPISSKKPIFDQRIEIVGVDLPPELESK
ncbi:uncharacterized protein HGUI_04028 [Hanseniaspora guilliermondii]|uniref:Uncharacterized protein n=1 Tax=Hanseniaspora guilliermondii TaxID=56406 RepID=A0A1L0B9K0_9ASCO|nr:uncharacterized protein HGUI_04028 [Hanseniaspora guilliermondii]